jgi:hypothetical protein
MAVRDPGGVQPVDDDGPKVKLLPGAVVVVQKHVLDADGTTLAPKLPLGAESPHEPQQVVGVLECGGIAIDVQVAGGPEGWKEGRKDT